MHVHQGGGKGRRIGRHLAREIAGQLEAHVPNDHLAGVRDARLLHVEWVWERGMID